MMSGTERSRRPGALLLFFHCPSNSGFAIGKLEKVFLEMARRITAHDFAIHFAYPDLSGGHPAALPPHFSRVIQFNSADGRPDALEAIEKYVRHNAITQAFGFDQPVRRPGYRALRRGGIRSFVSYWGAPISSVNHGFKLALKRLDVRLARDGPDHYIFESKAMQRTAVEGRGIPMSRTSVTHLGVDPEIFKPLPQPTNYAHDIFRVPHERRLIYYSGHMEERKGVHILVQAVVRLVECGRRDIHLLLLGNRPGEDTVYLPLYKGTEAEKYITFGGYRDDIPQILTSAFAGVIASTGWDSFTASSLEIAATGVPLIVSRLQGLEETVQDGKTGFTFPVGDPDALAARLTRLLDDPLLRQSMCTAARARVVDQFTIEHQLASLVATLRRTAV